MKNQTLKNDPANGDDEANLDLISRLRLVWWSMADSNRPPPACDAGALPNELIPQATT